MTIKEILNTGNLYRVGKEFAERVTLDLADDYYQIASESEYNYSKDETGKTNPAHKDVVRWHYFINDIYFAEYGSEEYIPYRVSINVKERADGAFVYSFSAEKQKRLITQRTLHAVVNDVENTANNQSSNNSISNSDENVKNSIKESLDWVDWDDYSTQETESLVKKVTELEKINEDLRLQIRHPGQKHVVNLPETQRIMRELASAYMSKVDRRKLMDALYDFYSLVANDIALSQDVANIHTENTVKVVNR